MKKENLCAHFFDRVCYYNTRNPPQYIIYFLLHPIRTKYLLLKVTSSPAGHFFSLMGKYEKLLIVRTGYASRPKQLVWQSVS